LTYQVHKFKFLSVLLLDGGNLFPSIRQAQRDRRVRGGEFGIETPHGALKYLQQQGYRSHPEKTPRSILSSEWGPHFSREYAEAMGEIQNEADRRRRDYSKGEIRELHGIIGRTPPDSDERYYMESFRHIAEATGKEIADYARDINKELAELEYEKSRPKGTLREGINTTVKMGIGALGSLGVWSISREYAAPLTGIAGIVVYEGVNRLENLIYNLRENRILHRQDKFETKAMQASILSGADQLYKFLPDSITPPSGREIITSDGLVKVKAAK